MACCAHRQRSRHKECAAAGHSRGDGMTAVCLCDVAAAKCHNVSCRVCKRVPEAAARIKSLHKSVLLDVLRELDRKIEKRNKACGVWFFFVFFSH